MTFSDDIIFTDLDLLQMTMICGDALIDEFKELAGPIENSNVDVEIWIKGDQYYGWNSLMRAIDGNHLQLVKELLSVHHVSTINMPLKDPCSEFDQFTPLLFALKKKYYEIVKVLLSNGADPQQCLVKPGCSWHGRSACMTFIMQRKPQLMNYYSSPGETAPFAHLQNVAPKVKIPENRRPVFTAELAAGRQAEQKKRQPWANEQARQAMKAHQQRHQCEGFWEL